MKARHLQPGIALSITLILAGAMATHAHGVGQDQTNWLTDYEQARKVARATGKPLFIVSRCQH